MTANTAPPAQQGNKASVPAPTLESLLVSRGRHKPSSANRAVGYVRRLAPLARVAGLGDGGEVSICSGCGSGSLFSVPLRSVCVSVSGVSGRCFWPVGLCDFRRRMPRTPDGGGAAIPASNPASVAALCALGCPYPLISVLRQGGISPSPAGHNAIILGCCLSLSQ